MNPESTLGGLGVPLREIDLASESIEAIAVWGRRHGPTVLVNTRGKFVSGWEGRRSTVAHELCHLLLDRGGSLPVAEVFGGRTPRVVEQRARAFAAEFLLPMSVAGDVMSRAGGDGELEARRLAADYGTSLEVVAWQARNSGAALTPEVVDFLARQVPPNRFFR